MKQGALIIVLAPSGSGKGTLVAHARSVFSDLSHTVSCTTRAPRDGEVDGVSYHFLTRAAFDARIEVGDFLEWAEYGGNLYGTLTSEVADRLAKGECIILEIEVQGARAMRALFPDNSFVIFIDAGPWEDLEARIRERSAMDEEEVEKRRCHYADERTYIPEADFVIHNENGKLEEAKEAFVAAIRSIRENTVA